MFRNSRVSETQRSQSLVARLCVNFIIGICSGLLRLKNYLFHGQKKPRQKPKLVIVKAAADAEVLQGTINTGLLLLDTNIKVISRDGLRAKRARKVADAKHELQIKIDKVAAARQRLFSQNFNPYIQTTECDLVTQAHYAIKY